MEIEPRVAPFRGHDRGKDMALNRGDDVRVEVRCIAGYAERAVLAKAARAPGDLSDFMRMEPSGAPPVELAQPRERDMIDVHVQSHPDRVGRNKELDLAGLE